MLTRFLKQAFNIREGRAPYHVIRKRFVNGARLTGSHLCILIIAMLIASIGLDIDSDIAIVGAMLICPLMGSVLAMAYGIATLDREITVEAIAGLALQMAFCLITSTLYFKLLTARHHHGRYHRQLDTHRLGSCRRASRVALPEAWATRATRSPRRLSRAWPSEPRSCRPCARRVTASPSRAGGCFSRRSTNSASTLSLSRWLPKPYCFFYVYRSSVTSTATVL